MALASFPALASALAGAAAGSEDGPAFYFLSFSKGRTVGLVDHRIVMSGSGKITPSNVVGGGSFVHFNDALAPPKKPLLGSGTWKAKSLIRFGQIGSWGNLIAGILEADVHLVRETPSPAVIPARLKVTCNIGPAGLVNPGTPTPGEGFTLTVDGAPGSPFEPTTFPGGFPFGLTVFTMGGERAD